MKKISLKNKKKIAFVASGGAVKAACFHVGVCLALERKGIQFKGGLLKNKSIQTPSNKMTIETYVGSSAGSMVVSFLAAGYSLKDIIKSFIEPARNLKKEKGDLPKFHYTDLFHLARPNVRKYFSGFWKKKKKVAPGGIEAFFKNHLTLGGIFTTEGIEQYLRKRALPTNRFEDLVANLFIVATQLDYPYKTIFCKDSKLKARPEHQALYESSVKISEAAAASIALPPHLSALSH